MGKTLVHLHIGKGDDVSITEDSEDSRERFGTRNLTEVPDEIVGRLLVAQAELAAADEALQKWFWMDNTNCMERGTY